MVNFIAPKFAAMCILGPITEEALYRGVLFRKLITRCGVVKAGIYSVLVFMLAHLMDFDKGWLTAAPYKLLAAGLIGGMGCQLLDETKCLWVAIVFHILANTLVFSFALGRMLM
jgi:membrane protease YdiL (CAAX protease family)